MPDDHFDMFFSDTDLLKELLRWTKISALEARLWRVHQEVLRIESKDRFKVGLEEGDRRMVEELHTNILEIKAHLDRLYDR